MKRILFFFLPFLPYLASAQVAKDTVTVLTIADIPAAEIRDTTNFTFVQDNAFAKATFDSLAKYTRVKLQTYTLDSTHIAANGLNLQGTRFTGVLPVTRGGTGNQTGLAATATALATGRTIQTNLASTSSATFDGTANITPGITGTLGGANGGTALTTFGAAGYIPYAASTTALKTSDRFYVTEISTLRYPTVVGGGFRLFGGAQLQFRNTDNSYLFSYSVPSTSKVWVLQNQAGQDIIIARGPEERVGINYDFADSASVTETLTVNGNARITAVGTASASNSALYITNTGVLSTNSSDVDKKHNIRALPYGLNTINNLNPVAFNWNDDDSEDIGFVAQDISQHIPETVISNWNGDLIFRQEKIIPVLVKAIQEQQAQIEALKTRITQLENK